jgi:hypothetical protein
VLLTSTRILPKDSFGGFIYAAHDFIYLWVKGVTFTNQYPWSWIWWGGFYIATAVWLASLLSDRSFIRRLYYGIVHFIVTTGLGLDALPSTAAALARWRIHPLLLRHTVDHERMLALHALRDGDRHVTRFHASRQLRHSTMLWVRLRLVASASLADYLRCAIYWSEAMWTLVLFGDEPNAKKLAMDVTVFTPALSAYQNPALAQNASAFGLFSPAQLAGDLRQLAALANPALQTETGVTSTEACLLLADNVAGRQQWLERLRRQLEYSGRFRQTAQSAPDRAAVLSMPEPLPALAVRLTLHIALQVAAAAESPAIALAYVDTLEGLQFALQFAAPTAEVDQAYLKRCETLIQMVPQSADYRACAILAERRRAASEREWQTAYSAKSADTIEAAAQLAAMRVDDWQGAGVNDA